MKIKAASSLWDKKILKMQKCDIFYKKACDNVKKDIKILAKV